MIRITVELIPRGVGKPVHLGTATIANDGTGTVSKGNYDFALLDKKGRPYKKSRGENFPRKTVSFWRLINEALWNIYTE